MTFIPAVILTAIVILAIAGNIFAAIESERD